MVWRCFAATFRMGYLTTALLINSLLLVHQMSIETEMQGSNQHRLLAVKVADGVCLEGPEEQCRHKAMLPLLRVLSNPV